ncbi:MAG: AAA family ATPase, partial [Beijerinckiaceae bacterium]
GGMGAVLWAGRRVRKAPARLGLTVVLAASREDRATYTYEIEIGTPTPSAAAFALEPQVKTETLYFHDGRRKHILLQRRGPGAEVRDRDGVSRQLATDLLASETALSHLDEPGAFPDQHLVRRTLASWRFYHDLRTDSASPMRQPSLATVAASLDADGGNLAAVFATLRHIRQDAADLDAAVADAFPGSELVVEWPEREARFGFTYPDFVLDGGGRRVFGQGELSDGTLRYLGLAGALFAYHRPPLVALNEPEGSLHPELMAPLAEMIVRASDRSQVWVVTHSIGLADAIAERTGALAVQVEKVAGATQLR